MSNGPDIPGLVTQFPQTNDRRAVIAWLYDVLEFWGGGRDESITARRHIIAEKVGKACQVSPNPRLPISPPNQIPGDPQLAQWLLVHAVNVLTDEHSDESILAVRCSRFVEEAEKWLGTQR